MCRFKLAAMDFDRSFADLNTSHVSVQAAGGNEAYTQLEFKYISCVGSSSSADFYAASQKLDTRSQI